MAYEVHLSQFEGPLDLLLHLIEQAKVDIKDIFISEITAQYLVLMGEVDELDMDTASEFLIMAATLVYIKSRSLLPRPPREDPEGEEDPEAILVRQLREYKAFKEAGAKLEALQSEMARAYTRLPEEFVLPPQEYSLEEATSAELYEAFFAVLNRETPEPAVPSPLHQVKGDIFTIRRQLKKIRSVLSEQGCVTFEALFDEACTRLRRGEIYGRIRSNRRKHRKTHRYDQMPAARCCRQRVHHGHRQTQTQQRIHLKRDNHEKT